MQVDLYSSSEVMGNASRLCKQIETRQFKAVYDVDGVRAVLGQYPEAAVDSVLDRLKQVASKGRTYEHIGCAGCDSVWELEALGLGEYSKEYSVIIDLSQALDLIMQLEFQCSREECRSMKNYEGVSRSLMNFDFRDSSEKFGVLFFESNVMSKAYVQIFKGVEENPQYSNCTQDEKMSYFVYEFYSRILNRASEIKDYIVADLQKKYPGQIIYRSKSFSSAIMTSSIKLDGELTLSLWEKEDYTLNIRSYKRYEWAREVMINELSRNSINR